MAIPDDYVGKRFGSFLIESHGAVGGRSEIYICKHLPTQNYFNLKLSIEEDMLWESEPMLPPINGYHLQREVEAVWSMADTDRPFWPIGVIIFYQVINCDYVIPLSSPWRLKNALSVERVLALRDAVRPVLHELSVLSDAAGAMLADAVNRDISTDDFMSVWGTLVGDDEFLSIQLPAVEGLSNPAARESVSDRILSDPTGSRFSDNRLLWLYAAMVNKIISTDEWAATLMCRWFRLNISEHEIKQFFGLHAGLKSVKKYDSDTLELSKGTVDMTSRPLASRAYAPYSEPNLFAKRETDPPILTRDSLVLHSDKWSGGGPLIKWVKESSE